MTLLEKLFAFCKQISEYDGPQETQAVDMIDKFEYEGQTTAYKRAFEMGYKRGYADCADYLAEWIDDEDEEA